MTDHFTLPDRLDSIAAPSLLAAFMNRRGQPLDLDASSVEVIGALSMEVIIAAGRQWEVDGHGLAVLQPSKPFLAACTALGLFPDAPWRTNMILTMQEDLT